MIVSDSSLPAICQTAMKIQLRTSSGFREHKNVSRFRCDLCGAKLIKGAHGVTFCYKKAVQHAPTKPGIPLGQHGLEKKDEDFRPTRSEVESH